MRWMLYGLIAAASAGFGDSARSPGQAGQRGQRQFGPGVCGPADPSLITTAMETGGQPLFLGPSEIGNSASILSASVLQSELILWASGDGERTYDVPIDSSSERATFSASFDSKGGKMMVISPDGAVVERREGTEDTVLNCIRSVTIPSPAIGSWQVRVTPTARFWLTARSKSELSLMTAEFMRPGGRPGHEGLSTIQGQPIAGKPAMLRVKLSSEVKRAAFGLVSLDSRPLQSLDMNDVDDDEFVGDVSLPSAPFRVVVNGLTTDGTPYQRVYPALFRAELVEVVPPAADTIVAGAEHRVRFTVRNFGPAVRLTLVAVDRAGQLLPVEPGALRLEPGAEAGVTVRVNVPATAPPQTRMRVTLTASTDAPSPRWNAAIKELVVVRN